MFGGLVMGTNLLSLLARCALMVSVGLTFAHAGQPNCSPADPACAALRAAATEIGKTQEDTLAERTKLREAVFPSLDATTVTNVEIKCREGGPALLGQPPCQTIKGHPGLIQIIETGTVNEFAQRVSDQYEGLRVDSALSSAAKTTTPVCNILEHEGEDLLATQQWRQNNPNGDIPKSMDHNWMPEKHPARACGEQCGMRLHIEKTLGFVTGGGFRVDNDKAHCSWEYGQYRGAFIQAQNHYKEKVLHEVKNKNVHLVSIEGSKPCQELAADVIRMQAGIATVTQEVIALHDGKVDEVAKLTCPFNNPNVAASLANNQDPTSIGACHVVMANQILLMSYVRLMSCEIWWRASNDFETAMGDQDAYMSSAKSHMKPKCKEAAYCKRNGQEVGGDCNDDLRTKLWNECYAREAPIWMKKKVERWSSSTKTPKAPVSNKGPNHTTSSNEQNWVFAFGMLGGLRRRRVLSGQKMKRTKAVLATLGVVLFAMLGAGCDCDDKIDEACMPCSAPTDQKCGCLYRACMEVFSLCDNFTPGGMKFCRHCSDPNDPAKACAVITLAPSDQLPRGFVEADCTMNAAGGSYGDGTAIPGKDKTGQEVGTVAGAILTGGVGGAAIGYLAGGLFGGPGDPSVDGMNVSGDDDKNQISAGGKVNGSVNAKGNRYTCLVPDKDAPDSILSNVLYKNTACSYHTTLSAKNAAISGATLDASTVPMFVDELKDLAGKSPADWTTFKKEHQLMEVDGTDATWICMKIAGLTELKDGNETKKGDGQKVCGDTKIPEVEEAMKTAFYRMLTHLMQTEGTADQNKQVHDNINNPAGEASNTATTSNCASIPVHAPGATPGGAGGSDPVAKELADARGFFGGSAQTVAKGSSGSGPNNSGSGAATAADKGLAPKAVSAKDSGHGGANGPINIGLGKASGGGAATTADSGGTDTGKVGGGADTAVDLPAGDAATAAVAAKGGFEGASSAGGGRGGKAAGPTDPFAGLFGGGAAGPLGVGNVGFGDVKDDGKADADGLAVGKFTLFEIVNRRMDKFGRSIQ